MSRSSPASVSTTAHWLHRSWQKVWKPLYEQPLQDIITDKIWHPMGAGEDAQWDMADATQQVRAGYGLHMTARDLWRLGGS